MPKMQHIVLLKVKSGVTEEQVNKVFRELGELQSLIPGIEYYGAGKHSSPEARNQGYTHGFIMTFTDAAARDAYLPHPEHERVKKGIIPIVDGVLAFDYDVESF